MLYETKNFVRTKNSDGISFPKNPRANTSLQLGLDP